MQTGKRGFPGSQFIKNFKAVVAGYKSGTQLLEAPGLRVHTAPGSSAGALVGSREARLSRARSRRAPGTPRHARSGVLNTGSATYSAGRLRHLAARRRAAAAAHTQLVLPRCPNHPAWARGCLRGRPSASVLSLRLPSVTTIVCLSSYLPEHLPILCQN